MKTPTYSEILPYIVRGLISEQVHPEDQNVRIFNYTPECQFSKQWDDVTLQCRGLIMDVSDGKVLARPFPKFFNYDEWVAMGKQIPGTEPLKFEKMDGSLGILYWLGGVPRIATRGSFTSDQALWATKWFRENILSRDFAEEYTYLYEIIYPANRIVVTYPFEGLVPLATIHTESGVSTLNPPFPWGMYPHIPETFSEALEALRKQERSNAEGYVLFWPEEGLRLKIKHQEYVRLHKLITGVSELAIWEQLRDTGHKKTEWLDKVPDEFYQWVQKVEQKLWDRFTDVEREADRPFNLGVQGLPNRKEQAAFITRHSKYPGVSFLMLDSKDYKQSIWRICRPKGATPFKVDEL